MPFEFKEKMYCTLLTDYFATGQNVIFSNTQAKYTIRVIASAALLQQYFSVNEQLAYADAYVEML
jgi:hypothetical protein